MNKLLTLRRRAANGAPPIPVAIDRTTTLAFADSTRQVFSEVTGQYKDFPANGTTDIITNVVWTDRSLMQ